MQHRTALSSVLAISTTLLAAGCAIEPRYDLRVVETQKDAFLVLVSVEEPLPPGEYRRIAESEVRQFLLSRRPGEVPVYEVRIDFLISAAGERREEKLATFWWTSLEGDVQPALYQEGEHMLVLY